MKSYRTFSTAILLGLATLPALCAEQEPIPEIAGLQKASADFVIAYNNKDSAAITALFTENAEMTDLSGADVISGRAEIKTHFDEIFANPDTPAAAIEVASVRLVTPTVAIEDGTFHLDPPGQDTPVRSITYTAVVVKNEAGLWQIASTRDLTDVTSPEGRLSDLADDLKGDWTCQKDGLRMDFTFGWDDSGKFLIGEMLTTAADAEPLSTKVRIGWDGARKTISWWTFDSGGGFAKGDWTPVADGWLLRNEGTSSLGEATSANGHLTVESKDTLIWKATDRLVDGVNLPDNELRIVRQAPEPATLETTAPSNP